ncbi:MAG: sigma-70 family RNA polymerase sigma factor [Candidatus Saccharimonadales bacterium]
MANYEHDMYFPGEALDPEQYEIEPDEFNSLDGETSPSGYGRFVRQLRIEAREVIDVLDGPDTKYLSLETEQLLATQIQAGIAAQQMRDKGSEDNTRQDEEIAAGERAKHLLVTANLPFAAYCARASMGIAQHTTGRVPSTTGNYYGFENAPGAIKKLSRFARPNASLEDRTQVAIEAMFKAADKFKDDRGARFTTFAVWDIGRTLEKHLTTENAGWDVADHILKKYEEALREEQEYGVLPHIQHMSGEGRYHDGLHPLQVFAGMDGVPLDTIQEFAPEEDDIFSDPTPLGIEDLVIDQNVVEAKEIIERDATREIISVLDTLSDKQAGTVSMRFGIDNGEPKTYDEIGKVYGVTRERIRQIESVSMKKLRHPSRFEPLRGYLDDGSPVNESMIADRRLLGQLVAGAANLRTTKTNIVSHAAEVPIVHGTPTRDPGLEPWQVYANEPWNLESADRV